jgi:ferredoxin, 2Fe-2S
MLEIVVENLSSKAIHCEAKTERLLEVLVSGTDWKMNCGGKGKCTTCATEIVEGGEHLSPLSEVELNYRNLGRLSEKERLACQCVVSGNMKVRVPDRNKLPHLEYSN